MSGPTDLLQNQSCTKIGQPPSPDASSPGAQRLPVLLRVDREADHALDRLNPTFCELYSSEGQPSVPPERLLLEQLHNNLLFSWFVGLRPDDPILHPTTFTKNRERLLNGQIMGRFLEKLMNAPEVKPLLSDEHFSAGRDIRG